MFRHLLSASIALLLICGNAGATDRPTRAWQQRLKLEIPLPVPQVELAAANPFVAQIDEIPRLKASTPPVKVKVAGQAFVGAYVTNQGGCSGAVPLDIPFPGLVSSLISGVQDGKWLAARSGDIPRSSWVVLQVNLESRVKEATIVHQEFAFPDPQNPPAAIEPALPPPSGRLLKLQAAPHSELSSLAMPKRLRVHAPSGERTVSFQALVHITAEGSCDRYVALIPNTGLSRWFSGYLGSWRLDAPLHEGQPTEAWLVYTARIRLKFSTFSSTSFRVLSDRVYPPAPTEP